MPTSSTPTSSASGSRSGSVSASAASSGTASGTAAAASVSPVGHLLREWRSARGYSQLDLAMRAGFSARHVSFIETGRTQPSRQALLILAETLDVPLRERNKLLEAGGYAHVYKQTPLAAEAMRHVRGVLEFILQRHEPYGAMVLDSYSNLLMANGPASTLMSGLVDPSVFASTPAGAPPNVLRLVFHPLGAQRFIVNRNVVIPSLLARAEREMGELSGDETAAALLKELRGYAVEATGAGPGTSAGETATRPSRPAPPGPSDLLLPVHFHINGIDLRLFSTIMTLGTPQDVTLQELRIETFFPADAESETALKKLATPS
jgi:transcriptional regulator with XRE-family HTH domain